MNKYNMVMKHYRMHVSYITWECCGGAFEFVYGSKYNLHNDNEGNHQPGYNSREKIYP